MGYHGDVRLWRVIALLLVLGVGAGPALLDPCLTGCHEPAVQAGVAPCHEAPTTVDTAATSIAGTAACGHDHTGIDADSPVETRSAARQLNHPVVLAVAPAPAYPLLASTRLLLPPASALHPHVPLHPPLRV